LDRKQKKSLFAIFVLSISAIAGAGLINLGFATYTPWVWHNSAIIIHSDGTISPQDVPIQRSGNEYTFTSDIIAGMAILRSNATINGDGHRLLGGYYGTGLLLQNASNIIVQNLGIQYFGQGIYFDNSNNSILKNCNTVECGVETFQSANNQITSNSIGGDISIDFSENYTVNQNNASSISISRSTNINISNNRFTDPKRSDTQLTLANYAEGIYIDNSLNCTITGNIVERKNVGIDIWQSVNSILANNTLKDNQVGFKLWGSDLQHNIQKIDSTNTVNGKPVYFLVNITDYQVPSNAGWIAAINCEKITVKNWISTPNWDGILFVDTRNSEIANAVISGNYNAIRFNNVSNTTITQSDLNNNQHAAFYFEATSNCIVTENQLSSNYYLFDIWHNSTANFLYNNNFTGNQTGILEKGSTNFWNNGTEGNYWSSFTGVDLNHDGVSDWPFLLDPLLDETDNYPLMSPQENQTTTPQNSQNLETMLAMPEEYLNYTISNKNGTIWAKIDGLYPMHLSNGPDEGLPMLYPIPPNTTNIRVLLNGLELNWSDYDSVDATARHHTDIGDWQMIYCLVNPLSSDFILEIHYEHPVQIINGSYTFLYDLNINPYLSPSSARSTAHFNIQLVQLPVNASKLTLFTTSNNGWLPLNFTCTLNQTTETAAFNVVSEYNHTLPGDIVMVLNSSTVPEFPTSIMLPLIIAVTLGLAIHRKRKQGNFKHKNVKYKKR
jgi:parallel beta-helix repeat protein